MFLRSKVQEMILRRRSRSMGNGGAQQSHGHLPSQHARGSTALCDGGGEGGALFDTPRLLHSSSLPATSSCTSKNATPDSEQPYSMSPTSVLDAFELSPDAGGKKRRPWCDGCAGRHGLADVLDYCADDQQRRNVLAAARRPLVRSCSLDRRVEFGVKNKSSWLPLRGGRGETAAASAPGEMEPSSEDYTCVISRGPNPRTVHIFGDRVVEGGGVGVSEGLVAAAARDRESSPRPINLPARGTRGFLSL